MFGFIMGSAGMEGARRIAKTIGMAIAIVVLLELIRRIYNRCPARLKFPFKLLSSFLLAQPFMLIILSYQRFITDPDLLHFLSKIHFQVILFLMGLLFFTLITFRILGWYIHRINDLTTAKNASLPRRVWEFIKRPFIKPKQSANPTVKP